MNRTEFIEYCNSLPGAVTDAPFSGNPETIVARHAHTRKWFALLFTLDNRDCANLKCEPIQANILRGAFKAISPAWHMNKIHWNMVVLDSDVPDDLIRSMTYESYKIT